MVDRQAADLTVASEICDQSQLIRSPGTTVVRFGLAAALAALIYPSALWSAEGGGDLTIRGTVSIDETLTSSIDPGDRLILKIFHPGEGVEHDPKYVIKTDFELPIEFRISPPIDMNARARWPDYVVEAFTDKDEDILSVVEGELFADSGAAMALGTHDVVLDLKPRAR